MSKILILGAPRQDKAIIAALIAQLGEQAVCVVDTMPPWPGERAMCPTGTMVQLRPPADMSQHMPQPKNHPDGWYRQFEKRSKRK